MAPRRRNPFVARVGASLAALLVLARPCHSIWPFPEKHFTVSNALQDAESMGIHDTGRAVAFGDFNGDQFLDVLLLSPDQQSLSVYLWDHDAFTFRKATSFRHPQRVYNVVPGDFTHDGKLDLLVMSQSSSRNQLDMSLYRAATGGGYDVNNAITVPSSSLAQPIPIDTDGDLKIDLLGMTPQAPGSFKVWQNTWNASQSNPTLFKLEDPNFDGSQCTLSNPHSSAVVDLNGDCLADIFMMCDDGSGNKSFQVWVNNQEKGYSLSQTGTFPKGVQSVSFADMDRDGTIDMVFSTCDSVSTDSGLGTGCAINIAYNQQLPLCASSTTPSIKNGQHVCRPLDELCTADPNFKFDLRDTGGNNAFQRTAIADLFSVPSGQPALLVQDTSFSPALPLPLRLGDANLDGFPDMLLVLGASGGSKDRTPKLLFSTSGSGRARRGWKVVKNGASAMESVKDARGAVFVDMDEDGTLDMMIQRTGDDGHGTITFMQNNFDYDAFFLKAIVLNGACDNGWCESKDGSERYHPFGVSYSGATYKYTVLDLSGRRSAAQIGQLPQTSYHALNTPYAFFGLGRTNNYIETLFAGAARAHTVLEGVIPNSRLVLLPTTGSGATWRKELFLRPGRWIPWVTVVAVVSTGVLAVVVFVLHLNEKREDELERRRASHHINFDAL